MDKIKACGVFPQAFAVSERIIFFFGFLCSNVFLPSRNTLQRIITEASAVMRRRYDAAILADHRIRINFSGMCAIGTEAINFFSKQQNSLAILSFVLSLYIFLFPTSRAQFKENTANDDSSAGKQKNHSEK